MVPSIWSLGSVYSINSLIGGGIWCGVLYLFVSSVTIVAGRANHYKSVRVSGSFMVLFEFLTLFRSALYVVMF